MKLKKPGVICEFAGSCSSQDTGKAPYHQAVGLGTCQNCPKIRLTPEHLFTFLDCKLNIVFHIAPNVFKKNVFGLEILPKPNRLRQESDQ